MITTGEQPPVLAHFCGNRASWHLCRIDAVSLPFFRSLLAREEGLASSPAVEGSMQKQYAWKGHNGFRSVLDLAQSGLDVWCVLGMPLGIRRLQLQDVGAFMGLISPCSGPLVGHLGITRSLSSSGLLMKGLSMHLQAAAASFSRLINHQVTHTLIVPASRMREILIDEVVRNDAWQYVRLADDSGRVRIGETEVQWRFRTDKDLLAGEVPLSTLEQNRLASAMRSQAKAVAMGERQCRLCVTRSDGAVVGARLTDRSGKLVINVTPNSAFATWVIDSPYFLGNPRQPPVVIETVWLSSLMPGDR